MRLKESQPLVSEILRPSDGPGPVSIENEAEKMVAHSMWVLDPLQSVEGSAVGESGLDLVIKIHQDTKNLIQELISNGGAKDTISA